MSERDESELPCDRCGKPRWKHHYFAGFGLLGGNGDHVYKPVTPPASDQATALSKES